VAEEDERLGRCGDGQPAAGEELHAPPVPHVLLLVRRPIHGVPRPRRMKKKKKQRTKLTEISKDEMKARRKKRRRKINQQPVAHRNARSSRLLSRSPRGIRPPCPLHGRTAGAAGEKNRGQAREASDFCNKAGGCTGTASKGTALAGAGPPALLDSDLGRGCSSVPFLGWDTERSW